MKLHLTEKLRTRLRLGAPPPVAPFPAPLAGAAGHGALCWYGHCFEAGGDWYILTANRLTLYSVVIGEVGLGDGLDYVRAFGTALKAQMGAEGLGPLYDGVIAPTFGGLTLEKTADASMLRSLNDLCAKARRPFAGGNRTPADLSRHLNDTPLKSLGFHTPREAMTRLARDQETTV